MKRILVIRGGAIGDFVLTLPAIGLLRRAYPQARLEILGYKHIIALAERRFYADAVHSIEYAALASFFARNAELPAALVGYFSGFDLVVSYLFDPDGIFRQNIERCGVESFLACSPKILEHEHAARQLARPLQELDLVLDDNAARLYPTDSDCDQAREAFPISPIIALHPGSGSVRKNWPLEYWIELIERLQKTRPEPLLFVGGEADGERLAKLRAAFPAIPVAENLALPILAAVVAQSALFIGHDSGISHIAAAVGTRCLLLFGPTDSAVWAPANAGVEVVAGTEREIRRAAAETNQRADRTNAGARAGYELMRIGIRT